MKVYVRRAKTHELELIVPPSLVSPASTLREQDFDQEDDKPGTTQSIDIYESVEPTNVKDIGELSIALRKRHSKLYKISNSKLHDLW